MHRTFTAASRLQRRLALAYCLKACWVSPPTYSLACYSMLQHMHWHFLPPSQLARALAVHGVRRKFCCSETQTCSDFYVITDCCARAEVLLGRMNTLQHKQIHSNKQQKYELERVIFISDQLHAGRFLRFPALLTREKLLTHTGPLSERHEGAEDAMNKLGSMLNGETSLQLQCAVIISHPANDQMLILRASRVRIQSFKLSLSWKSQSCRLALQTYKAAAY